MDEVFWSNVVKRWSDASENVIILKEELAKVQGECALYRHMMNTLQAEDPKKRTHEIAREDNPQVLKDDNDDTLTILMRDELQDAEVGLSRAKYKYRRLQQELISSVEEIKTLKQENERLSLAHQERVKKPPDEPFCSVDLHKDQRDDQFKHKHTLVESEDSGLATSRSAESQQPNMHTLFNTSPQSPSTSDQEIRSLKQSLEARDLDNRDLREELDMTRNKLLKTEENCKKLLDSIVKLQNIARHSARGILHSTSSNSLRSELPKSSRKSPTAANHSSIVGCRSVSHTGTLADVMPHPDTKAVTQEIAIDNPHFLPPSRQKAIAKLPSAPLSAIDVLENVFDRDFLKLALGKGLNSVMNHNGMDKNAPVLSYLSPTLNHHPWCPAIPGQHGFLFVGLGKDESTYQSPATRNLFVGLPKNHSGRTFRYLGKYKVVRVKPLSVDEWDSLSNDVRRVYSQLTRDKLQDTRSLENILFAYKRGDLSIPCVQLQYMGFDDSLYAALLAQKNKLKPQ